MLRVLLEVRTSKLMNNADEFVKQANGAENRHNYHHHETDDNYSIESDDSIETKTLKSKPHIVQEMNTFKSNSHNQLKNSIISLKHHQHKQQKQQQQQQQQSQEPPPLQHRIQIPIPALPPIEPSHKVSRSRALTIEEYENDLRESASDLELVERVFLGSMNCNQLRAALWPYLFGIVKYRGKFKKLSEQKNYLYIEHEQNIIKWNELKKLYSTFRNQWKSILPDQESRFSAFRERKSLIERDVIRCDRLHPFYAEQPRNLALLTELLITYMMYDFDIGYVQGMSDLAAPILYTYNGDLIKSFWVFVEVMKLFRRNFELTQKTIHFQLNYLFELIKNTDPNFARYLEEHESSNCFFAFRAIVCLFKRELMKEDEGDYGNVLLLWDTIWCAKRLNDLKEEDKIEEESCSGDSNQSNSPRNSLTETEIFVLSLCLSMIRRDRNLVLANKLDGTDIHLHFINPKLASNLNSFIENGINIYSYIRSDIKRLTTSSAPIDIASATDSSPQGSPCSYDLLKDFLIITGVPGS